MYEKVVTRHFFIIGKRFLLKKTSPTIGAWKCGFPPFKETMTGRHDQPTGVSGVEKTLKRNCRKEIPTG